MKLFSEERPYIENEFENARFDESTGLSAKELSDTLQKMQEESGTENRPAFLARAYGWLLDNVQLEINEHTPFSVKINIGVNYHYFAGTDIFAKNIFEAQRGKILAQQFPEDAHRMWEASSVGVGSINADYWHTVPNWEYLLKNGFAGILHNAEMSRENLLAGTHTAEQIEYLDCVISCYRSILRLFARIYEYSLRFSVPQFSAAIKKLTEQPPETLYEVMLFSVLYLYVEEIGCERARTLGAIDRLYLPYYRKDLADGADVEDEKELFRYFFIHFTATKRFAEQPFTMCGGSADGTDYTNELSFLMLDVYDSMDIYDPKIHFRYHRNLNPKIFEKVVTMIRKGHSSICLLNDEAVFRGYEKIGIPRTDAEKYVLLGCYEPIIMGLEEGEIGVTWLNMVKSVEFALNGGCDMKTGKQIGLPCPLAQTFEEFMAEFLRQLDYFMDFAVDFGERLGLASRTVNPSPIYSATFPECLAQGCDVHEYPLKYNNMSIKPFGLATVVDSLTAVKKYVFEQQRVTLAELRDILKNDWQGADDLRTTVLNDREKYGNNAPLPDSIMTAITEHMAEKYCGMALRRGGKLRLGLDSITNCISQGRATAATPDGRGAGQPFSKNLCAVSGKDFGGITGYMQSVLKIDSASYLNSAVLDFVLHPSAVEGEKGLCDFMSLLRIFFMQGGFAIQGNIINAQTLRNAQKNPDQYRTLQIRVCGWNEYFVKLNKVTQDQFIIRSEAAGV